MTVQNGVSAFDAPIGVLGQPVAIKPAVPDAEDFPLSSLPPKLAAAIAAIMEVVQVPASLAAQSVIGACALPAQARIMIELPTREVVPASLFLLTIAASGDRKTSSDKRAVGAIYEYEAGLREAYEPQQTAFSIDKAAFDSALAKAKKDGGKDRHKIRENIEACGVSPRPPALPMLLVESPTMEGIVKLLDEAYPAVGLFSDEGAAMLGGYSMQDEKQASTGAQLSQLWDGKPIKRVRGTDVTKILTGVRLSVHLMVQPGVAGKLFSNKALRDQGMLSRMLVAFPKTMKGQRLWREPTAETWAAIDGYKRHLGALMRQAMSFRSPEDGSLEFVTVSFTPDARALWIAFSDHIERQLGPGGKLEEIADLASKMSQHAARLAAVIAYYANHEKLAQEGISAAAITAGIRLCEFYLAEALRLFNTASVSEDSDNAAALIEFIRKEQLARAGKRWLGKYAPKQVRPAEVLQRALNLLIEHGHLVQIKGAADCEARGASFTERVAYTVIYPEADA